MLARTRITAVLLAVLTGHARSQVLVQETFDGSAIDNSVFTFSGPGAESFFGRTHLNSPGLPGPFDPPPVENGTLRLRLQTFNPFGAAAGNLFLADEVRTRQTFAPTDAFSFEFTTRARFVDDAANPLSPGLVGGAFLFGLDPNFPNPFERDEIDFELLSNTPTDSITTNIFNDQGFDSGGDFRVHSVPGLDLTEFNEFRIVSSVHHTIFFVNDTFVRLERNNLAIEPQDFRLNINAPDSAFSAAFSGLLQPTANPAANQTFIFEVDSLLITRTPTAAGGDLNGDGFVGAADLDKLLTLWNQAVTPGVGADLTGDGFVGAADLDRLLNNWNLGVPPAAAAPVPEPGGPAVFALAAWAGALRRFRR